MSVANCVACVRHRSSIGFFFGRVSSHTTRPATMTMASNSHHRPVSPSWLVEAGVVAGDAVEAVDGGNAPWVVPVSGSVVVVGRSWSSVWSSWLWSCGRRRGGRRGGRPRRGGALSWSTDGSVEGVVSSSVDGGAASDVGVSAVVVGRFDARPCPPPPSPHPAATTTMRGEQHGTQHRTPAHATIVNCRSREHVTQPG